MNRRGFLSLLGLGTAGMVLDPELALWRPGAKTIFLPPPTTLIPATEGVMVTSDWIVRETLAMLENNLTFSQFVNREYDRPRVGDKITMPRPARFASG